MSIRINPIKTNPKAAVYLAFLNRSNDFLNINTDPVNERIQSTKPDIKGAAACIQG